MFFLLGTFGGSTMVYLTTDELKDTYNPLGNNVDWGHNRFLNIHVLPNDMHLLRVDESKRLTWEFVYENIMRYYYLLYPFMSSLFDMSDKESFLTRALIIKLMTSKENWKKTWFMPVTREMSQAKRQVLHDYLTAKILELQRPIAQPHINAPIHPGEVSFVIKTKEQLIYALLQAVEQEQGLMIQYLFAMFTLKTSGN